MKYIVCVATPSRFAQASVLRQSCEEHMPRHEFKLVEIKESPTESIYKTVSRARIETCLELFSQGAEDVIHIGADYLITAQLYQFNCEAVFLPHITEALHDKLQDNVNLMRAGYINSDLQIWKNTSGVIKFLNTVLAFCSSSQARDIFEHEQTWLPLAVSTLKSLVVTDPGYGVAWYNLHERKISSDFQVSTPQGRTGILTCFHFSGFDVNKPGLSIHAPNQVIDPAAKDLLELYREKVKGVSFSTKP